jgi:hypothetical protein
MIESGAMCRLAIQIPSKLEMQRFLHHGGLNDTKCDNFLQSDSLIPFNDSLENGKYSWPSSIFFMIIFMILILKSFYEIALI